jgi:heterodisulfide reductase subunit B
MKFGFFPGCNMPALRPDVEQSLRLTMPRLGIEIVDLEGYVCCPAFGTFPSADEDAQLAVNAWNLSLGEEKGCDLIAQCGSCYSSIKLGSHLMKDSARLARVNKILGAAKKSFLGSNTIRHITDILYHEVGIDKIQASLSKNLEGMHCVVQFPCHTLYPSNVVGFEPDRNPPHILIDLVKALGATVETYSCEYQCCGGSGGLHKSDVNAAHNFLKKKLDSIQKETKADFIVTSCITCLMWMDNQQAVLSNDDTNYAIPVFDYNQLLALCMGFDPKQVTAISSVPRNEVIEKIVALSQTAIPGAGTLKRT